MNQNWLKEWLTKEADVPETASVYLELGILLLFLILICWGVWYITKAILLNIAHRYVKETQVHWDDILFKKRVFHIFSQVVPAILVHMAVPFIFRDLPYFIPLILGITHIYIVWTVALTMSALLNALQDILSLEEELKDKPIASFVQLGKIIVFIVAAILTLSIALDKNPLYFLSALGAVSAVLILVFRDTILGFVASIQVSVNDMVRVGDWIVMDKYAANGNVIKINLATVKVQNWDNTITTIPPYAFISDSFQNYRAMQESGGRRFRRSFHIKMASVRFCSSAMLERFKRYPVIADQLQSQQNPIPQESFLPSTDHGESPVTNLEVFRLYGEAYLAQHADINEEMMYQIHQLDPDAYGIPIEVYAFSRKKDWKEYEKVAAGIMEHLISVVDDFDLEIFEVPTGSDWKGLNPGSVPDQEEAPS